MQNKHINGKYSWIKHIDFLFIDILTLFLSFSIAFYLKFDNLRFAFSSTWKGVLIICCLLDMLIILFTNTLSGVLRRTGSEEVIATFLNSIYNFVVCCIFLYVLKIGANYSRTVIISTYIFYFILSSIIRIRWKKIVLFRIKKGSYFKKKTILVVGERDKMPALIRSINSGFLNQYEIKGVSIKDGVIGERVRGRIDVLDDKGEVQETYIEFVNSVTFDNILKYVLDNNIDEVFIDVNPAEFNKDLYEQLIANGKAVHISIQGLIGFRTDDQFITTVGTYKALGIGVYSFSARQLVYFSIKRIFDIVFGLIGMVLLLPLLLIVKIAYLCSKDTKSILYTQERVGINGRPFKMYKFRSMVHNADEILVEMLKDAAYKKEWDENQKFENDPRITKIGNFLRKTSLDEIPQFLNVLKGDMSLIGPRPLIKGELEMHGGLQLYYQVKPGITGWWGCNGRSNTTYDERLELEYYYVKNCSLYMDVLCIVKTLAVVLKKEGAR